MECIGCRESWMGGLTANLALDSSSSSSSSSSSCSQRSASKQLDGQMIFRSGKLGRTGYGGYGGCCLRRWKLSSSSSLAAMGERSREENPWQLSAARTYTGGERGEWEDRDGGDVRERERVEWPTHVDRISSVTNHFVRQCVRLRQSRSYRNERGVVLVVGRIPLRKVGPKHSSMQSCTRTLETSMPSNLCHDIEVDGRFGSQRMSTSTNHRKKSNMSKPPRREIRADAARAGGESHEEGDAAQARRRKLGNTATARINEKEEEIYSFDSGWAKSFDPSELGADGRKMFGFQEEESRMSPKQKREREKALQIAGKKSQEPQRLTHKMLRVMAGKEGGRKLWSPADEKVRPMMEVVRGAVFSMLQALAGSPSMMPAGRWLDLYSGTGSVGIEALSRGCQSGHFVELDPWVINNVLSRNLDVTNFTDKAVIHLQRVEAFLERAEKSGAQFAGGVFDYVSVTPPYEAVVYSELMSQIARSPLIGQNTCIIVEYPRKSKAEILDRCGPLHKIRDRRYGRTNVAVYGPEWAME